MLDTKYLVSLEKGQLEKVADKLEEEDIRLLVALLEEKDDDLRYKAFLLLEKRSEQYDDVYPHWEFLEKKLSSANSYQRSSCAKLLAANTRWDKKRRMRQTIESYLLLLKDEKPITIRQAVQALPQILAFAPYLKERVKQGLDQIDYQAIRPTMRNLVKADADRVLSLF